MSFQYTRATLGIATRTVQDNSYTQSCYSLSSPSLIRTLLYTHFFHTRAEIARFVCTVTTPISSLGEAKIRVTFATMSSRCVGNPSTEFSIFCSLLSCFSYLRHQIPGRFLARCITAGRFRHSIRRGILCFLLLLSALFLRFLAICFVL